MKKFLATLALLIVFATPAFAQSFDPDSGTGNVRSHVVSSAVSLPGITLRDVESDQYDQPRYRQREIENLQ